MEWNYESKIIVSYIMNNASISFFVLSLLFLASCQPLEPAATSALNQPAESISSAIPPSLVPQIDFTPEVTIPLKPLQTGPIPPIKTIPALPPANSPPNFRPTLAPPILPTPIGDPFKTPAFDLARRDLGKRLGIPLEQVKFVSAEEVTWRDAALGCPQPGMFYAQVLSPGYRLLLEAAGQVYTYHTDLGGIAIWCEQGEEPLP